MTSLHHIGYWVYDLDAAMKQWSQDLGVGPFHVIEHVTFESFVLTVGERTYDDVVFDHAAAFAAWGPVVVELNQVHAIDDRLAAALNPTPGADQHRPLGSGQRRLARRRAAVPASGRAAPAQRRPGRHARPPRRPARLRG
jgi:hypothetical protein